MDVLEITFALVYRDLWQSKTALHPQLSQADDKLYDLDSDFPPLYLFCYSYAFNLFYHNKKAKEKPPLQMVFERNYVVD